MKKLVAKLFIALVVLSGIPNLGMANTNFLTTETSVSSENSQNRYFLKIRNESRWNIKRIYMSNAETDKWGPDQLGESVLYSGRYFTLEGIRPAEYDIMLIDQDNDKCILRNIAIFENKDWTITSDWLLKCQKSS